MRRLIETLEAHPIVALIVLIGGIAGGIGSLWAMGVSIAALIGLDDDDLVISGRVCPVLYETDCFGSNAEVLAQLGNAVGQIADVDLRIEWGGSDVRGTQCPDAALTGDIPDDHTPDARDFRVFALPVYADGCDAGAFMGFDVNMMDRSLIPSSDGGEIYVIRGTFLVGVGELMHPTLPQLVWPGWYQLKRAP